MCRFGEFEYRPITPISITSDELFVARRMTESLTASVVTLIYDRLPAPMNRLPVTCKSPEIVPPDFKFELLAAAYALSAFVLAVLAAV